MNNRTFALAIVAFIIASIMCLIAAYGPDLYEKHLEYLRYSQDRLIAIEALPHVLDCRREVISQVVDKVCGPLPKIY